MSKSVKVCCFCETWESGGIESFLYNVLRRIDLKKINVDIVAASLRESVFTEPLQQCGVRFIQLSGNQRKLWENYRLFVALLQTEHYDVVHLNLFHGLSLYYVQLAKWAGVSVRLAHSHNTALRRSVSKPLKLFLHNAAKELFSSSGTELLACSASAAKFLFSRRALAKRGACFIPNGIDTARFQFDRAGRKAARVKLGVVGKFVIGNVGRLCDQKNQRFLLDVFIEVLQRKPESCLLLVGDGEQSDDLRQKATRLGIADKVIFYGVSRHVEKLMWAMDVFAFPSRFEGLGIVAVEAQAAGLPVLCSEHVPNETRITPLFQILLLKAGPIRWAEELLKLDADWTERAEGAAAVRKAGFDIVDVADQMGTYYGRCKNINNCPDL